MKAKKLAGEKAVELIEDGMIVGLGTGSTAFWAIQKLGSLIKSGMNIRAIPTSKNTENLAIEMGIPLTSFSEVNEIDITIDGADEINLELDLIKGGGGALLREKIVAFSSRKFVVIADETKYVQQLGKFPLPVEVVPFGRDITEKNVRKIGGNPKIRYKNNQPFITDNGNYILDCYFDIIDDPGELNTQLNLIPGVVENGLFVNMTDTVIIGYNHGEVKIIEKYK